MSGVLGGYKSVDAADVYKSGHLAAQLTRRPDGAVEFGYLDGYDGRRVAATLPVQAARTVTPGGGVPAFFAGLLPEGHRLTVLRRATKTSMSDELTLLLAVGADTPGDVQIVPSGEAPSEPAARIDGPLDQLDFRELTEAVDLHALPGVQQKASAVMLTRPIRVGRRDAILKAEPAEYPGLVRNEAAHLGAMRTLRIPVARAQVVADRNSVEGLLVERFDRVAGPSGVKRLELEDAAQLLGVLPADKYRVAAEDAALAVLGVVAARPVAARNLLIQFLFAWLSGNGDLHAKNLSALRDGGGTVSVAPVYDVLSTAVYADLDLDLALPVAGRVTRLRWRHWRDFAAALGVPDRVLAGAVRLVLGAVADIDLADLGYRGSPLRRAERELRHRRAELPDDVG